MLKKITTAIVSGCLAVSMIPTIAMAEEKPFSDVDYENGWYVKDINWAYDEGLMSGYGNGTFGIGDELTRAEFAQILANWAGVNTKNMTEDTTGMVDMSDNQWYTGAANWAVETGLIEGYDNGNVMKEFGPNDPITREMAITILNRIAENLNLEVYSEEDEEEVSEILGKMPDGEKVSDWAKTSVAWALNEEIISGRNINGYYFIEPKDLIVREEIATIVHNTDDVTESTFANSSVFTPSSFAITGTIIPTKDEEEKLSNKDFKIVLADDEQDYASCFNNGTTFTINHTEEKVGFSNYVLAINPTNEAKWEITSPKFIEVKIKTYVNDKGQTISEVYPSEELCFSIKAIPEPVLPEEPEIEQPENEQPVDNI